MSQRKPQPRRGQKPADAPETENDRIAGRNPVLEALRSDAKIDLIYVGQESGGLQEIIRLAKEKGIPVKVVTESKLSQLTGGAVHQGVAAEGACGTYVSLEELLERAAEKGEPPLLVLCDGIPGPSQSGCDHPDGRGCRRTRRGDPQAAQRIADADGGKDLCRRCKLAAGGTCPQFGIRHGDAEEKRRLDLRYRCRRHKLYGCGLHRRHGVCHRLRGLWHEPPGERKVRRYAQSAHAWKGQLPECVRGGRHFYVRSSSPAAGEVTFLPQE